MAKKKKKKKVRRFPSIFTVLFIGFLIYVLITVKNQHDLLEKLENEKAQKEQELAELNTEVASLNEDMEMLNDPERFLEVIEKIAREEYKMVKPYETMYIDKNKNENKFIKGIGDD
jgi:cell division protein FtsB